MSQDECKKHPGKKALKEVARHGDEQKEEQHED